MLLSAGSLPILPLRMMSPSAAKRAPKLASSYIMYMDDAFQIDLKKKYLLHLKMIHLTAHYSFQTNPHVPRKFES